MDNSFFYKIFFVSETFPAAGLFLVGIIWEPVNFFVKPLLLAHSRKNEREADDAVLELTSETGPFKKALVKLTAENLSNLNPHPLYVIFNYSHPPVTERIRRIK
jgi:STE24 endopeptidase